MKIFVTILSLNLVLSALCLKVPSNVTKSQRGVTKDQPLKVVVTQIGDRYAVFNITGADTVNGSPVVDLNIKYTINGPTDGLKTQTLNSCRANGELHQLVEIVDLLPGRHYDFQFSAVNAKKETGPPSNSTSVLLLPPTPDITVDHPSLNKLKVKWDVKGSKSEDYYLLTVEKKSALGCGVTLNITNCFGNKFTLDDLEVGEVYKLTLRSHNPSGFSEPVVVSYPID